MQCEEALLMIEAFMNNKLHDHELSEFLEHLKICPNCYDELEIYYTIKMGMQYLETEKLECYDIPHMLKEGLREKERYLHRRKVLFGTILGVGVAIVVAGLIVTLFYLGHIRLPELF